jgi:hypothetical protein
MSTLDARAAFRVEMVAKLATLPKVEALAIALGILIDLAVLSGIDLERAVWALREAWKGHGLNGSDPTGQVNEKRKTAPQPVSTQAARVSDSVPKVPGGDDSDDANT